MEHKNWYVTEIETLRSSRGASLIELLVAVGIMGILGLGMATMMANNQKEVGRVRAQQELAALSSELQSSIFRAKTCNQAMRIPTGLTTFPVTQINSANGAPIAVLLASGDTISAGATPKSYSNLRINSVKLTNAVDGGLNFDGTKRNYTVQLSVQAESKADKVVFSERDIGQFTMEVNAATGAPTNCFIMANQDNATSATFCKYLNGTVDASGKCQLTTAAEDCARLGGSMATGKCETLSKQEMCSRVDGIWQGGKCVTSPMPQRCRIQSDNHGSGSHCCGGDEVVFTAFAPGDLDFRLGFANSQCINVSDVGNKPGAIQLLCCK